MDKSFEIGTKVKASEEAKQQGINIPVDAKIKYDTETDEIVTIEFTRKTGNRASERIHRSFLELKEPENQVTKK